MCRRVGERLCTSDKCPTTRRSYPPGVHGPTSRSRLTPYGIQLLEKQKAKRIYGILERQFRNYVERASAKRGDTGELLVRMLETRLDNVVYRLGFASSRAGARQAIIHGHIAINGKKVDVPSYIVRPGEIVKASESSSKNKYFVARGAVLAQHETPSWLKLDPDTISGTVLSLPEGEELKQNFQTKLIVEFYSR